MSATPQLRARYAPTQGRHRPHPRRQSQPLHVRSHKTHVLECGCRELFVLLSDNTLIEAHGCRVPFTAKILYHGTDPCPGNKKLTVASEIVDRHANWLNGV